MDGVLPCKSYIAVCGPYRDGFGTVFL